MLFHFSAYFRLCVCVCLRWWSSKVRCFTSQNPSPSCSWARRVSIGLEELMGRGLHLSDIPIHDATHVMSFWWVCQSNIIRFVNETCLKQKIVWLMNCYLMETIVNILLINVIIYCFDFISYFITPLKLCYRAGLSRLLWKRIFSGSGMSVL